MAFCGIARPLSFWSTLEKSGITVHQRTEFPDHHPYSEEDCEGILRTLPDADWLITTEKDAGKIAHFPWPRENVLFLRANFVVEDEEAFWDEVEKRALRKGKGR